MKISIMTVMISTRRNMRARKAVPNSLRANVRSKVNAAVNSRAINRAISSGINGTIAITRTAGIVVVASGQSTPTQMIGLGRKP